MGIFRSRPEIIDTNIITSHQNNNESVRGTNDVERGLIVESLINVIRREYWNKARALLRRSDARLLVENTDGCNYNALHWACGYGAPSDIIQAMLNASETAPLKQNQYGQTPLHWAIAHCAIIQSSKKIIIMLLEACPRATLIADNDGMTPLHRAIDKNRLSDVIRRLLAANPTAATTINNDGYTPLHLLFGRWNASLRKTLEAMDDDEVKEMQDKILPYIGYELRIGELYQRSLLLLQAATHGSIQDEPEYPFQPLCAAINDPRCPWLLVKLIMRMDPMLPSQWDREGHLPIHVAAAAMSSHDEELQKCWGCQRRIQTSSFYQYKTKTYSHYTFCQNCFREQKMHFGAKREEYDQINSVDKIPPIIKDLLVNSDFAAIPDGEGRLPLHIAIENEKQFEKGHETILRAAPKAVNTRDIKTHMYPFQHAAVTHDGNANELKKFTSCFALLTDNPHLVFSGIPLD